MKLSLLTPTYNSAATLPDTLASVAGQTYQNVEHWLIDGGSTDGTIALLQNYEGGQFISEPDQGLYDAMNKGIAQATGEVVGILNSDDFYAHPQVLEQVMTIFEDPTAEAVYGDLHYVDPQDTERIVRQWRSQPYESTSWCWGWMPPHPTFFVRRRLYEQYGNFDLRFRTAADYELMLRFCYKHAVQPRYLPEVLVKMRAGGVSNASIRHRLAANQEDRLAWQVNGLKPYFFTTWLKPIRKIRQFF